MSTRQDNAGTGCVILILICAAIGYGLYEWLDSIGWIVHREDTFLTAQSNWFVGESKDCIAYPLGDAGGHDAIPRIHCDDGPEHSIRVTFYGRVWQPGRSWTSWRCTRSEYSFTCKQTGAAPDVGSVEGLYEGQVQNLTVGMTAASEIALQKNGEKSVTGCLAVHRPLYGSGRLTGTLGSIEISFDVPSDIGSIRFTGTREAGGEIMGTYTVRRDNQDVQNGEFTFHRRSALPVGFSSTTCADDSVIH